MVISTSYTGNRIVNCRKCPKEFKFKLLNHSFAYLLLFLLVTKTKERNKLKLFLTDSQPGYVLSMFLKFLVNLSMNVPIKKVLWREKKKGKVYIATSHTICCPHLHQLLFYYCTTGLKSTTSEMCIWKIIGCMCPDAPKDQ